MVSPAPADEPLLVACLCAQWCGTCGDYRTVLREVLAGFDPALLSLAWVDIEDHDDVVGSIDVENFPTLLVARGEQVLFFGTVTPHAQTLRRLVQGALQGSLSASPADAETRALAQRIRAFQASGPDPI
jgi:thioredoxin 1